MKTAIICPLWNHLEDLTKPFVESILKTEGEWELILVDNGSQDGTSAYLKRLQAKHKRVKIFLSQTNTGFGGGNNLGYGLISKDVKRICFISNDVLIGSPNWLTILNQFLDREPKSLIGPQYVDINELTSFDHICTPYIAGWCMFSDRELFDQIAPNVFDKDFPTAYFEDVWLSVRAVDLGYRLLGVPIDLQHLGSKSSDQIDIPKISIINRITFLNKMMYRHLQNKQMKRIVFFAGNIRYPFIDEDYEGRGVGGAEASLIQLSREFAKAGWRTEIYNKTDVSGTFNGVRYYSADEFIPSNYIDVFVLYREWHPVLEVANASVKLFWSCDQYTDMPGVWDVKVFPHVDKIVAISPFHKSHLDGNYITNSKVVVIGLGVKWDDYKKPSKKVVGRAIYCSVPMRGLELMFKYAPEIKEKFPAFELIITSDYRLWGLTEPNNEAYVNLFAKLPYVKFLGKVDREKLVHYQKTSQVMAYPCTYDECFCISALECMAAGAIPVTTNNGALPTTVGDGGILLSNSELDKYFVKWVVELFENEQKRLILETKGRKLAEACSWDKIFNKWLKLINEEISMKKRKASSGMVEPATVTAPVVGLPKFVIIKFTRPVEFAINGRNFSTKPQSRGGISWNQVEVPYENVTQAISLIRDAYGADVIMA